MYINLFFFLSIRAIIIYAYTYIHEMPIQCSINSAFIYGFICRVKTSQWRSCRCRCRRKIHKATECSEWLERQIASFRPTITQANFSWLLEQVCATLIVCFFLFFFSQFLFQLCANQAVKRHDHSQTIFE